MEQCQEEKPFFMAFAETCLKKEIKEVKFDIRGYSHLVYPLLNQARLNQKKTGSNMRKLDQEAREGRIVSMTSLTRHRCRRGIGIYA